MRIIKCQECGTESEDHGYRHHKKYCSNKCRIRANARAFYHRNMKNDNGWNAKKQRIYRKKHPDKFNYVMARHYFRKLPKYKKKELMME